MTLTIKNGTHGCKFANARARSLARHGTSPSLGGQARRLRYPGRRYLFFVMSVSSVVKYDHVTGTIRHPWLAAFFAFGTLMCALTVTLLIFPGTALDSLWRLNPDAHQAFESLGAVAIVLMLIIGIACGSAAVGLWRGVRSGTQLAILILSVNIAGDLFNAVVRHDYRALIGLPIGGAMIYYLLRSQRSGAL